MAQAVTGNIGVQDESNELSYRRSIFFGHFLNAHMEQEYIAMLCEQWRRRIQVLFCVLSLHFTLMSVATVYKDSVSLLLAGSMMHNGTRITIYDLAPATGVQAFAFPVVTFGFTACTFIKRF